MNLTTNTFSLFFLIFTTLVPVVSFAQNGVPKAFNVQGTIYQPGSNNPFVGTANIRFQILNQAATCVMYQETVTGVNTTNTNGAFSVDLGTTATRINYIDSTTTLGLNLFKNNVTHPSITGCAGSVVIGANETRKLRISFDVSGSYSDMTPDIEILTAPYAMIAETLDGHSASEFIMANTSAGLQVSQTNLETLLNNLTKFNTLNNFATTGDITGNAATATTASSVSDGAITASKLAQMGATNGQVMKWNGSAWAASSDNSGVATITSSDITTAMGYTPVGPAGTIANATNAVNATNATTATTATNFSGSLSGDVSGTQSITVVNSVGGRTSAQVATSVNDTIAATNTNTINTIVKRDGSGNIAVSNLSATNVSSTNNSIQNLYLFDNLNINRILFKAPNSGITNYTLTLPPSVGTNGQVLSTSASGDLSWITPSSGNVTSVAGRTGVVTLSSSDITGLGNSAGLNTGTATGTVAAGDDARFTDTRTPTNDSVTSAKILDGTITSADISIGAITFDKINSSGAAGGQVIKWDGIAWVASSDDTGAGGTVTSVTAAGTIFNPITISGSGTAPTIDLAKATGSVNGYLSSADWTTFSAKQAALGYTPLNPTNNLSDLSNAGTALTNLGLGTGQSPTFTGLTLSGILGNTLLRANGSGVLANATSADITGLLGFTPTNSATAVISVAGRTGIVTLSSSDITGLSFGTTSGTYAQGNDSRFTDPRTPTDGSVTAAKLATAANGELYIGNGTGFTKATLTGTSNQLTVTNGSGAITLSTPQDIHTGASPSFTGLILSGITGNTLLRANGSGLLANATSADITGLLGFTPTNPASAVTSVAGRTGIVTLSSSDITGLGNSAGLNTGTATGTVAAGDDLRFTDTRTPTDNTVTSAKIVDGTITSADISAGAITFDKINSSGAAINQVIKWSGSAWVASSDSSSGGTVISVTSATTDITISNQTTTPQLTLNAATTGADKILKLDGSGKIDASTLPNSILTTASILSGDVSGTNSTTSVDRIKGINLNFTSLASGNFLNYDGTHWINKNISISDLKTSLGAQQFANSCATNQTLTWSAVTDAFSCSNIAISISQISGLANSASVDTTNASNISSGTLSAARLPTSVTDGLWTANASGDVSRVTGNVGIGTATPGYKLDVAGDINVTGNFRVNGSIIGGGSGTVTEVSSANADIGVATGTTTPVLTLNSGTGANQILKLNGSSQIPAVDGSLLTFLNATNLGSGTVPEARMPAFTGDITTSAGSVATTIATNAITSAKILDGTITSADISSAAVTFDKLNQSSATTGQVIKWSGSAWVASADSTGGGGGFSESADFNLAAGNSAISNISTSQFNVAIGREAGAFMTGSGTDGENVAVGYRSLLSATSSYRNVGIGSYTLSNASSSTSNVAIGYSAGQSASNGGNSVYIGVGTNGASSTWGGVALGNNSTISGSNPIAIGTNAIAANEGIAIGNSINAAANTMILGSDNINTTRIYGNVGIGTTTPLTALHVTSSSTANGLSAWSTALPSSTSGGGMFSALPAVPSAADQRLGVVGFAGYSTGTTLVAGSALVGWSSSAWSSSDTSSYLTFETADGSTSRNERMRITASGNVGIGTTSPTYQLQLSTDSAAKPGTSTWTIASDERLKDIRAPFTRGLNELMGLNTIYFNYKKDNPLELPSNKEFVGIKAQDAQKAIPESVTTDEKGFLHVTNDSIIWTAVNAIKELYSKVLGHDDQFVVQSRQIASKADKEETDSKVFMLKNKAAQLEVKSAQLEAENVELKARLDKIEKMLKNK